MFYRLLCRANGATYALLRIKMIHHYVNLVCWRAVHNLYHPNRDIIWADSISMVRLLALFGYAAEFRPGTSVVVQAIQGSELLHSGFFLTARPLRSVSERRQLALPRIAEGRECDLPAEVCKAIESLAPGTPVAIGISAPKQNRVATVLHSLRPDLTYHCLGAALSLLDHASDDPDALKYSRSGAEWMRFLQEEPMRTLAKLRVTLAEIACILVFPRSRKEFREFAQSCQTESRD